MTDFKFWLESLEIQTLTDELKQEIIEYAEDLIQDAYYKGYGEAKHDIINHITYDM